MNWNWVSVKFITECTICEIHPGRTNVTSKKFQVKIVIIDSITFHFRQDFEDFALRNRLLGGMALKLMNLGKKYTLAVSYNFQFLN